MISQTYLAVPVGFFFKSAKSGKLVWTVHSTEMFFDHGHEPCPETKPILSC